MVGVDALFQSVAVFVLATTGSRRSPTASNGAEEEYNYLERRLLPLAESWGRFFPHLFFVLGTNEVDYSFTLRFCNATGLSSRPGREKVEVGLGGRREGREGRRLVARSKQVKKRNVVTELVCRPHQSKKEMRFLWTGNCSGEYFGMGPTCRCQESLRFFLRSSSSSSSFSTGLDAFEWFIFVDGKEPFKPPVLLL